MSYTQRYVNTQNETASPQRMLVLLLQAAYRHMMNGAMLLEADDVMAARTPLAKASDIVAELLATLDARRAPELVEQLKDIYVFVARRLVRAQATNDVAPVREALRAFLPILEGFEQAVASLGEGA